MTRSAAPVTFGGREYGALNGYTVTWEYLLQTCMYVLEFHGPNPDDEVLSYSITEEMVRAIPDSTYKGYRDGYLKVDVIVEAILSGLLPDLKRPRRVSVRQQVQQRHGLTSKER